jgi:hypothetical protein
VLVAGDGPAASSSASSPQTFTIRINKPYQLYNTAKPLDVDGDGYVSAIDAVLVINYLNRPAAAEGESLALAAAAGGFLDTDKDNSISAIDAVLVINWLNFPGGGAGGTTAAASSGAGGAVLGEGEGSSGESSVAGASEDELSELVALLAQDELAARRKRGGTP